MWSARSPGVGCVGAEPPPVSRGQRGRELQRAGGPVVLIDARNISRRCPRCGHTAKANRPTRDHFAGVGCGLAGPADQAAAVNVRDRARTTWAFVNTPVVADTPQPTADTSDKPRTSIRSS
ncbi:zinc ribbon domain-containing protein [Glycomyces rhizosphaerae]|uniref:Zinc ribbon domain-containing protein n=1 Tax=Glycomyces rhizosphaerae TaxID=2054422 RepID=A0ABV7Q3C7_9ACTN